MTVPTGHSHYGIKVLRLSVVVVELAVRHRTMNKISLMEEDLPEVSINRSCDKLVLILCIMHLLTTDDAFPSPVSSVPQCTKANLKCLKKLFPELNFTSFLVLSLYKVKVQGLFYRYA